MVNKFDDVISADLLDTAELGMRNVGRKGANEIDSIKNGLVPVKGSVPEQVAGSNIPTPISGAMTVLLACSIHNKDIDINTGQLDADDVSFATALMASKIYTSYAIEGRSQDKFTDALMGAIGGGLRKLKRLGRSGPEYEAQ